MVRLLLFAALIMAADDWSQGFEAPFVDEVRKLGAELVLTETVMPGDTDARAVILRLIHSRADAVLAPLYANALYSFLKQARELRFTGSIHVGDGMFEEDLKIAGAAAEGVFASQIWLEAEPLARRYRARFGSDADALQLGLVAGGYDWVKHLQAVGAHLRREGKKISRRSLETALKTFRTRGFLGEQMYGGPPQSSGEINVVVKNGRYVPVK